MDNCMGYMTGFGSYLLEKCVQNVIYLTQFSISSAVEIFYKKEHLPSMNLE